MTRVEIPAAAKDERDLASADRTAGGRIAYGPDATNETEELAVQTEEHGESSTWREVRGVVAPLFTARDASDIVRGMVSGLKSAGWSDEDCKGFVLTLIAGTPDDAVKKKMRKAMRGALQDVGAGRVNVGWTRLAEATANGQGGWDLVDEVRSALGVQETNLKAGSDRDVALAALADVRGIGGRIVFAAGSFHRYDPALGIWRVVPDELLQRRIQSYDGKQVSGARGILQVTSQRRDRVMEMAQVEVASPKAFESAASGFAFSDAFVAVEKTGLVVLDHAPEHFARTGVPFPYEADAKCPEWDAILGGVFEGDPDADAKKLCLQEFTGAAMTGRAPSLQRAVVLFGTGANGKSTVGDVIAGVVPEGARAAIPPQEWTADFKRHALSGALLNVVTELPEREFDSSEAFKAIIVGDFIGARAPYGSAYTFKPTAGHLFLANRLPGSRDQTPAFWRRFIVISFNGSFTGARSVSAAEIQGKLEKERAGIMLWALRGAVRVMQQGHYTVPPSSDQLLRDWQASSDSFSAFLNTCTETWRDGKTQARCGKVYSAYQAFCRVINERRVLTLTAFGRRMAEAGLGSKREDTGRVYAVVLLEQGAWLL